MHIAYYTKELWEEAYIRERLPDAIIRFENGETVVADADAEVLCVFMDRPITKEVLATFPNLKLIATRSTGFDHIDLAAAKERGVVVVNVPSYGVHTVAEFAAALLLALTRRIIPAQTRIAQEHRFTQEDLGGIDLAGKTMGVVGTGRIGAHFVSIATGLGMRVVAYDQFQNKEIIERFGVTYLPLPELLSISDAISIHVPYTKDTHHLFNRDMLAHVKKGAYLVNTARGAVIDTTALIEAIDAGVFGGVGLDVLEDETASQATIALANRPNVIVTPHVAFDTREAKQRIMDTTIDNIVQGMAGTPTHEVKV